MCRATRVLCVSLVVFLLSSYTTALVPSWLSAVSFKCKGKLQICAGALIDEQWMLTTASCFQNCYGKFPQHFKAFLNIPERDDDAGRAALKSGFKAFGDYIQIHPNYDPISFANNLALVKLECHNLSLNIDADIIKAECSMPMDCGTQSHSGYLHSTSSHRLRYRERNWEMDPEGNLTLSHCSVALGMDNIYYCANQPVAVSCDKMSECVQHKRTVPTTPICHHYQWITSIIKGKTLAILLHACMIVHNYCR